MVYKVYYSIEHPLSINEVRDNILNVLNPKKVIKTQQGNGTFIIVLEFEEEKNNDFFKQVKYNLIKVARL